MTKIGSSNDGGEYASYHYDDLSRRDATTLGNSRSVGYSYWADSTLQDVRQVSLIDDDANTSTPNVDALWSFTYTPGNQVKTKQMPSLFQWEPAPTQVGPTNYAVNGLNQYTSVRSQAQMYDAKGNLTSDGVSWQYTYDAENRMMTAVKSPGNVEASYDYDALDRRIGKTVDTGTEVTTRYLWLGQNIVAELDDEDEVLRRYVHGAGVDEPVAMVDYTGSTPTTHFYHADHLGSVVALSDAAGEISETYSYSAYGEGGLEGVEGNPFRFTGRQLDPETGLYYYRARYYSPALGRFMQVDPMGDVDSLNLYQYALWNPVNAKDSTGLTTVFITVVRTNETSRSTMGRYTVHSAATDKTAKGYTLELPGVSNPSVSEGRTRIKAGSYSAFVEENTSRSYYLT